LESAQSNEGSTFHRREFEINLYYFVSRAQAEFTR
jgi:hypothetical protein